MNEKTYDNKTASKLIARGLMLRLLVIGWHRKLSPAARDSIGPEDIKTLSESLLDLVVKDLE